jgi:hypothetical protein
VSNMSRLKRVTFRLLNRGSVSGDEVLQELAPPQINSNQIRLQVGRTAVGVGAAVHWQADIGCLVRARSKELESRYYLSSLVCMRKLRDSASGFCTDEA